MSSLTTSITEIDLRSAPPVQRHRLAADFRRTGLALGEEVEGPLGEPREIVGGVAHDVLRHGAGKKLRDETRGNVDAARGKRSAGLLDGGAGSAVFSGCRLLDGHEVLARV